MKARTFEGWKLLGYYVRKGEKATGRDKNDKATFTRDQVEDQEDLNDLICDPYQDGG